MNSVPDYYKFSSHNEKSRRWLKLEISRIAGREKILKEDFNRRLISETKVYTRDENGRWVESKDLKPSAIDLLLDRAGRE